MTHHVAIGKIDNDEIIVLCVDGIHQFVLHLVGTHFGLQVVGSHFRRRHKDAVFTLISLLTATIEEEGDMGIFLGFCSMQLAFALLAQVFAKGIHHVFLGEKDVHAGKRSIIRRHTIILKVLDGVHTLGRHILLGEHLGKFLGAVVAEIDEDHYITFLYGTIHSSIVDGLYKFVCHILGIAFFHGLHHIRSLLALALYEQVVGFLHTFPTLVTIHGIKTTYDAGNVSTIGITGILHLLDKTCTAFGIGVTTVHETVNVGIFQAVCLGNFNQFEQVLK